MKRTQRKGKGNFADVGLPVAERYPMPASRLRMVLLGLVAAALVVGFVLLDRLVFGRRFLADGPLSSSHAAFTSDCESCHSDAEHRVTNEKCSVCHEKFGDQLGVYTFAAHYLYRSDDFRRLVPSEHETPCYGCHDEHQGREAQITRVRDGHCLICHTFGSFNDRHPQFDFAAENVPDPAGIRFPHAHHVREVMKREQLVDVERACLYCHNARPDGRSFEPIDFDRHCDACHLTVTTATPALPVLGAGGGVGVETLEEIRARFGPGTRWALFTDPGEFRRRGDNVSKAPVHHKDPWVLENLRRLRGRLYRDAGLADLLVASTDVPDGDVRVLYREAISTLEDQAVGLRGVADPGVQAELAQIDDLLAQLKRRVEDPYAPLDETRFLLALESRNPEVTEQEAAEIESLVNDLTEPCRVCHTVQHATIARVQKDQRVLRRAEFNHRAHIVQRRCLDCHTRIPIQALLDSNEGDAALRQSPDDRAEIQDLPTIETCRECHNSTTAANRCVTCHYFHANKSRRSDLLLYLK